MTEKLSLSEAIDKDQRDLELVCKHCGKKKKEHRQGGDGLWHSVLICPDKIFEPKA